MSRKGAKKILEAMTAQCSRCEQQHLDWRICPFCHLTYCSACFFGHQSYCHTLTKKEIESKPKIAKKPPNLPQDQKQ